jgi:14-3-3 protein epsilon
MTLSQEMIFYLARVADKLDRPSDVVKWMNQLIGLRARLNADERNLWASGYRRQVNSARELIRAIEAHLQDTVGYREALMPPMIEAELQRYRRELESHCLASIHQIETVLLPDASDAVGGAFYHKMAGDFYRYLAEASTARQRAQWAERAEQTYRAALALARREIARSHPLYLEIAVNFAVCLYDLCGDHKAAIRFAEQAFNDAVKTIDALPPQAHDEATSLMQLLRENLTQWEAAG